MASNKEIAKFLREVKANGWTVAQTSGSHLFLRKGGEQVLISGTPSDRRAMNNIRGDIRRAERKIKGL